jgi:hypothetical protein
MLNHCLFWGVGLFCFVTGYFYVAQAGLELTIHLPASSVLGLQASTTMSDFYIIELLFCFL